MATVAGGHSVARAAVVHGDRSVARRTMATVRAISEEPAVARVAVAAAADDGAVARIAVATAALESTAESRSVWRWGHRHHQNHAVHLEAPSIEKQGGPNPDNDPRNIRRGQGR